MSGTVIKALHESTGDSYFQDILNEILEKLRDDPSSITTEDARRLSENAVADDLRTAKIISAVEAFAAASEFDHEVNPQMDNAPHTSLLTVVNDLRVTVDRNPTNVTTEILRSAQAVVSSKCSTLWDLVHGQDRLNMMQKCRELLAIPMRLIPS
jgi:hypothetical protein